MATKQSLKDGTRLDCRLVELWSLAKFYSDDDDDKCALARANKQQLATTIRAVTLTVAESKQQLETQRTLLEIHHEDLHAISSFNFARLNCSSDSGCNNDIVSEP